MEGEVGRGRVTGWLVVLAVRDSSDDDKAGGISQLGNLHHSNFRSLEKLSITPLKASESQKT